MKRFRRILAFVLAIVLMLTLLPSDMTLRAEEAASGATSITLQANDSRIHRSSGGVKAPADEGGRYKLETVRSNMTYDLANGRNVKVCLYNYRDLMTKTIGTSSDKGIDRYPYVVTKINVKEKEAGKYKIKVEFNMNSASVVDSMAIVVDGVMHIVKLQKTDAKQFVEKELYLSEGVHNILYTSVMPQNENDCPGVDGNHTNATCYPWANFWSFTFEKGSNNTSVTDINDCIEVLDASTLTGTDVENIIKESTRIEAEDTKYVTRNIYSTEPTSSSASGGKMVGGPSYSLCKQTFADLETNGLVKDNMPYLQYVVDAPVEGYYYVTVGAQFGTSNNSSNPVPYVAVLVNGKNPVKAQFDNTWGNFDSVTVPVYLQKGANIISCTSVVKDDTLYEEGSSAWVNLDYFELQNGLTARPVIVSADDSDCAEYLRFAGGYTDSGSNFGGPQYGELREDFPSLYEDMLGIYSASDTGKTDRWPTIAFTVDAAQDGYYTISASTDGMGSGDACATTVGMIVDGATYVVDIEGNTLSKSVYLSAGKHVIIFTSPIYRDMVSRPSEKGTNKQYVYLNYKTFTLSEGLGFVKETDSVDVDIVPSMTNYSRIEAEDFAYVITNGKYDTETSKEYVRKYNSPYTVKVKGTGTDANTTLNFEQIPSDMTENTSYVQYTVNADKAGTYVIRVGAFVGGSGTALPYGTILVNDTPYKAQFSGNWNGYDAVNIPVVLNAGENTIKCIGVTADQACKDTAWIGYDFIDIPSGVVAVGNELSAAADNFEGYLYLNSYTDVGAHFGGPNYEHMRWDYPSLYEDMRGIINKTDDNSMYRWPYIAFKVKAEQDGEYQINANITTIDGPNTIGMIVDGAMYVVDVTKLSGDLTNSVYLTKGEHVIIFTSQIPRDMIGASAKNDANYRYVNFNSFKVSANLNFVKDIEASDILDSMKKYTRIESEDFSYVTTNGNYSASTSNTYTRRYGDYIVKVKGVGTDANTTLSFEQIPSGITENTPYVQYTVIPDTAGKYMIRVGAFVGGSGTNLPYGTILVNDKAYKAQFSGNWNGYDVVNLWVDLEEGVNTIKCIGVTADQACKDTAWIGYDFIEIPTGVHTERKEVSASDDDCENYVYLNRYEDKGANFGDPGSNTIYPDMRYDYPSLYEDMLGIYSAADTTKANRWPYVALKVNAEEAGVYEISVKIGTKNTAETIGMIVDGAMYVIDVTTTSGYLTESVYLAEGDHVIIFTSPMPRDLEGALTQNNDAYPYMDFVSFKVSADLNFVEKPTETDIQTAMTEYARIEVEDFTSESVNGNYTADISKDYVRRYNKTYTVEVKGFTGAVIDGTATDEEKKVNTTQTFDDIKMNGLKPETSYVEHTVIADEAGTYMIRVGAYIEGSGNAPYGTILVNNIPYKVQFSGNWNGYDAVTIPVEMVAGKNTIQLVGVTADQTCKGTAWIGYDFVDVPRGIVIERSSIKAADTDWDRYLYLNRYKDSGTSFGGPDYNDMRYDFPSLYEDMLGIYSDANPDRAGYWPYIAFKVYAEQAGTYRITTKIKTTDVAKTIGMIVDGTMHVVDVTTIDGNVAESVYLTAGEHVVIFTPPMPSDMQDVQKQTNAAYPYMDFKSFKLSTGLIFGGLPTEADIQSAMATNARVEAEDLSCVTTNGNYNTDISKTYTRRYGKDIVKVKGFTGAAIDGAVSAEEKKVNTTQTYDQIAAGNLDKEQTSYIQYTLNAKEAGSYVIRVGAYVEGSGTMPYGTIMVNGKAYKAQFTGDWNRYKVANLTVELKAGQNTIQCIGVTGDQTGTNGWIGYDFIDVPRTLDYHTVGEYTNTSLDKGFTFEKRTTYETDGAISQSPYTMSAWVYVPSGYLSRGGVIFGNYVDNETPCANFELDVNGVPIFHHINAEGKNIVLTFDMVSVCADEWTNLTFTISGNDVSCYKNGVLVATLTSQDADIDMDAVKNQYLLGGDLRPTTQEGSPNVRYFRGRILDVALYDKALSKEEVLSVYKAVEIETKPFTRYKLDSAKQNQNISDTMGNNDLFVKIPYFKDKEAVTDYAYSFAVIGDTQIVTENDIKKGEDNLSKIYDWILANQESKNIQFVLGLGDITDNNNIAEWEHALSQISKLDGKIPYSLVRGNHDLIGYGTAEDKNADYMTQYLGTEAYRNMINKTGDFYDDDNIASSYSTLTVGKVQYLILALDFGSNDDVIEWANGIIENHPNHQVIITTHAYLYRDGTTLDAGDTAPPSGYNKDSMAENEKYRDGDYVWENLVSKHKNVVLVLSGHDPSDNIIVSRDKGENGNIVTSMLIDPQGVDSDDGSTAMMAMFYFSEDGTKLQVECFSTVKDAYFKDVNQFTIELFNEEVSASDADWDKYVHLNLYEDKGEFFGVGNGSDGYTNYGHIRYDYPSLYEDMLGIYSDAKADRAGYWPYIAFTVNAEKAGEYQISAEITTNNKADTIGMIVDGAMHVVDVSTKKGDISETVYLTKGKHVIIFTSPMPRDMEGALEKNDAAYPWMDFKAIKLGSGLHFGEKPTEADVKTVMTEYTRVEAESISYVTTNGNYNTDVSKTYTRRYSKDIVKVKGFTGAVIDGTVTDAEKKVNTTQTFEDLKKGNLDAQKTSYVQYKVLAEKAGSYMIRVGAYVEGSGTMPYGTILVNGKAYKAQFTGNWNGYDAVSLEVKLEAGENIIQCIGVTADQTDTNGWIGYDFIDISRGIEVQNEIEHKEVSASDEDWNKYLYLNKYKDTGASFGDPDQDVYPDLRYDYPSLYEDMLGIYSDVKPDRANYWPYIAFTVSAEKAGEYQISAEISTNNNAKTIGMIVDGTMYVVDVTTTSGDLTKSVYLTEGEHVIIFTSPMPRDMEGALEKNDAAYPWMDYVTFKLGIGLNFGEAPTEADVKAAMTEYTRVEAESISYVTTNGNYNTDVSKTYKRRYGDDIVKVKGFTGAVIDGTVTDAEKQVNTTQTFEDLKNGALDAQKTSYVQYKVLAEKTGSYKIRVGAYVEGSGTMPYGTILVNGKAYKAQFSGNWNGYDAATLTVELQAGENIIQCIGVTADQTGTNGWIGYDFIDVSREIEVQNKTEHKEVSAGDEDWDKYLYVNRYEDKGTHFAASNYADMRYDYPSLYEDMLGIYSDVKADRAGYWPYIAFTVSADKAGEYQISAKVNTKDTAKTVGMIVDGAMYIVDVTTTSGDLTKSVYLTAGEHVIIFTSPMPRDMEGALEKNDAAYPWMDFVAFKLGIGLSFGKAPTDADVKAAMTGYTRIEAEDIVYATYNVNYGTDVTKNYPVRYKNAMTTIMGASGAIIDGTVTAEEKKANTSQTYAQLSQGLDANVTSYVQYKIHANEAGTYMIRIGAYLEGSGTMPYGTILVNGIAYKVQFTGNWNGYDAVNLPVELKKGTNTIQCVGVTADQTGSNAWIGYDYLDIQKGLSAKETGATLINAGDENYVTFNKYEDKGDTLGSGNYDDMRWDRMSLDILNYAYLSRMPYAAIEVTATTAGTYDIYFTSQYDTTATSKQMGVLVDGVTTYTMTVSEFRSHVSIPLSAGKHTLVFTTPMPEDMEAASMTAKFDKKAYPWMDMKSITLGKGLVVEKAPTKRQIEIPFETIEVEEYAMPNMTKITENGAGSALYLKAQKADAIVKNGIDPTVTPYVQYQIDASEAGEYTIYVALNSGMSNTMTAEKKQCSIVIENGDDRQVKTVYSLKDTQGVVRVIPVTLKLEKGINEVRITHFTGDSIQGKGYVWNDFDYISMSPETAKKLTFLPTSVLEAEDAAYSSYSEKMSDSSSGEAYLGSADYGYIDENKITFDTLDVNNLDDLPRVTYTFEAEKAGTYTLSVKFNSGLINYKLEDLEKISFAVIVNGKDKQLVEYEMGTLDASTTRAITVDLVEGENEITFTATLAEFMNAVSPRIESEYRLVWVDHDALHLSYGLSSGKEAEKFSIEDSSVEHPQLNLSATVGNIVNGVTGQDVLVAGLGVAAVAGVSIPLVLFIRRRYPLIFKKRK